MAFDQEWQRLVDVRCLLVVAKKDALLYRFSEDFHSQKIRRVPAHQQERSEVFLAYHHPLNQPISKQYRQSRIHRR